jgi:hypothetical protein
VAKTDELNCCSILIGGKKYGKDVPAFAGGRVKKRKGGFLLFGSHEIKIQEVEALSQGRTEVAVVGIKPTVLPI